MSKYKIVRTLITAYVYMVISMSYAVTTYASDGGNTSSSISSPPTPTVQVSLISTPPAGGFVPGDLIDIQVTVTGVNNSNGSFRVDLLDNPVIGINTYDTILKFGSNIILHEATFSHGMLFRTTGETPDKEVAKTSVFGDIVVSYAAESNAYTWLLDKRFRNGALDVTDVAVLELQVEYVTQSYIPTKIENGIGNIYQFYVDYNDGSNSGQVSEDIPINLVGYIAPEGVRTYTTVISPMDLKAGESYLYEIGIIAYGYPPAQFSLDLRMNQGFMPYWYNNFYNNSLPLSTIASRQGDSFNISSLSYSSGMLPYPLVGKNVSDVTQGPINGFLPVVMLYSTPETQFKIQTRDEYCYEDCSAVPVLIYGGVINRFFFQGSATLEKAGDQATLTGSISTTELPNDCLTNMALCKTTGDLISAAPNNSTVNEQIPIDAVQFVKTVSDPCIELGGEGSYTIKMSGADFRKVGSAWFVTDLIPDDLQFVSITENFVKSEPNNNFYEWGFKSSVPGGGINYMFNNSNFLVSVIFNPPPKMAANQGMPDIDYNWYDHLSFEIDFSVLETANPSIVTNTSQFSIWTPLFGDEVPVKAVAEKVQIPYQGYEELDLGILVSMNNFIEDIFAEMFRTAEISHQIGCSTLVVSGYKFEDHNANGVRDQGDQGLEGWKITLQGAPGTFEAYTDANGFYTFENLKSGVYQLREERKEGWLQSFPAGEGFYNVSLTQERSSAEANFGNYRTASVHGYKYVDLDGSGSRDDGEPAMEGVRLMLRALSGQVLAEVLTDANGYYSFTDIIPGHYAIFEDIPEGMYQSQPGPAEGGFYYVVLTSGVEVGPKNFGNYYLTDVRGDVYFVDQPPLKQVLESLLNTKNPAPGIIVTGVRTGPAPLKSVKTDAVVLPGLTSFRVETDENGHFEVLGLLPGLYTISVESPNEFTRVVSQNPLVEILISGGFIEVEFDLFFDEYAAPEVQNSSITGSIFADANGNNFWMYPAEIGVEGRTVTLTGISGRGNSVMRSTVTNSTGIYVFNELPEGRYVITVQSVAGVSISVPITSSHVVMLKANEHLGAAPGGSPGGAGWLTVVQPGVDATFGTLVLAVDTNLDGVADVRWDLSGVATFDLEGSIGQSTRPFALRSLSMHGVGRNGEPILAVSPSFQSGSGEMTGSGANASFSLLSSFTIVIDGSTYYSDTRMPMMGTSDRWPVRNTPAVYNVLSSGEPVVLRDPFGRISANILYAQLTPTFGADFAAERVDFGDAPATYGTLRSTSSDPFALTSTGLFYPNQGARHLLPWTGMPMLTLGASVTADVNGQPNEDATGDFDNGVTLPVAVAPNSTFNATVNVTGAGLLSVWVDQNRDGRFDEGEKLIADRSVETGEHVIALNAGTLATSGTTFIRVRLSTQAGVGATGLATDGEVEDYQLVVNASLSGGGQPTSDNGDESLPTTFALYQNYPNPFNPTTVIPYDLASSSRVRITVYDVTGRPVATVLDAQQNAGRHQVAFNAAGLPSGVYMIRMEAGGQVLVRKLTLLK